MDVETAIAETIMTRRIGRFRQHELAASDGVSSLALATRVRIGIVLAHAETDSD